MANFTNPGPPHRDGPVLLACFIWGERKTYKGKESR